MSLRSKWTNNSVVKTAVGICPLHEAETHLLYSRQQTLHCPSAELSRIICNFFGQTYCCLVIKIFAPVLTLFTPFWENETIQVLIWQLEVAVNLTSNTDIKVLAKVPNLINVADANRYLVFILDIWVIFIKFFKFTSANMV